MNPADENMIAMYAAVIIEKYFAEDKDVISIAQELMLTTDFVATIIRVEYNEISHQKNERRRNLNRPIEYEPMMFDQKEF